MLGVLVLLGSLALLGWWAWDTVDAARTAQQHAAALESLGQSNRASWREVGGEALGHVYGLRAALDRLDRNLGPLRPAVSLAAGVSPHARRLDMALRTLDLGREVATAGEELGRAAEPLLAESEEAALKRLGVASEAAIPHLYSAQEHLERAAVIRTGVDRFALEGRLAPFGRAVDLLDRALPPAQDAVRQLADVAPAVPSLLGMRGPRSYLILGQNQNELRATGGFIGSMGLVTLDQGALAGFTFGSSYQFDDPGRRPVRPPQEMAKFMNAGVWYIRDANWWADFSTSAAQVRRFWEADQRPQVEGVVAIDDAAVGAILDAVGPVYVAELGRAVDGTSFPAAVQERLSRPDALQSVDTYQGTKSRVLGQVMNELVARMQALTSDQTAGVITAVWRALQEKHILLALSDRHAAALAQERQWDGALLGGPHEDYLYLVDTTLAYSEASRYVRRELRYQVEADPWGKVTRSVAEVTYRNTYDPSSASAAEQFAIGGLYWDLAARIFRTEPGIWGNFVRLFVPKGSRLNSIEGLDYPPRYTHESGKAVLGGYFLLRPGQTRVIRFDYVPPVTPLSGDAETLYRLTIQAQPGVSPYPVEVRLTLESRGELQLSKPGAATQGDRIALWRAPLEHSTEFSVRLP